MMRRVCACSDETVYFVEAEAVICGNDITVAVCGGTGYHVGATALAVYEPERDSATVSVISVHTHRDDQIASYFAKEISREMKCTVSVSVGIHIDNATEREISLFRWSAESCCEDLIRRLKGEKQK